MVLESFDPSLNTGSFNIALIGNSLIHKYLLGSMYWDTNKIN